MVRNSDKRSSSETTPSALKPFAFHGVEFKPATDSQTEARGSCILCDHEDPKFYVNTKNQLWDCKHCGKSGNLPTFFSEVWERAKGQTKPEHYRELSKQREGLAPAIFRNAEWVRDTLFSQPRWLIPYRSAKGSITNLRVWQANTRKTLGTASMPQTLWRLHLLKKKGPVFIAEGEPDALVLETMRKAAKVEGSVLAVPGANSFADKWKLPFRKREVYLIYDADQAGRDGAEKASEKLRTVAATIHVLRWPDKTPDGFDVRDYYNSMRGKQTAKELWDGLLAMTKTEKVETSSEREEGEAAETDQQSCMPPNNITETLRIMLDENLVDEHFAKDAGNKLYHYANGVYSPDGEEFIDRQHVCMLESRGEGFRYKRAHTAEQVAKTLATAPMLDTEPPANLWNLANGLLNLDTGELQEHDPALLTAIQYRVDFDPKAKCPRIDKFFQQVLPPDSSHLGCEIVAGLLTPSAMARNVFLFLGDGGNGKGVLLNLLLRLVGRENASTKAIHDLEHNRFATANLCNKVANICGDMSHNTFTSFSIIKSITGGDEIQAEEKYGRSFSFRPFCKLFFAVNAMPPTDDTTQGFYDRMYILPFLNRYRDETSGKFKEDKHLIEKLTTPKELSGLLNKALTALPRVRIHGVERTPSVVETCNEYRRISDPVAVWLENNVTQADTPEETIETNELYTKFRKTLKRKEMPPTKTAVTQAVKAIWPTVKSESRKVKTETGKVRSTRFYYGLKYRDIMDEPV